MTAFARPGWPSKTVGERMLALFGIGWSLFGVVQFASQSFVGPDRLMARGMTEAQAVLYAGLPGWMTAAFGIGVFGGVIGSALLLLRQRAAVPVLGASLAAYALLSLGDLVFGVFAEFGPAQAMVLAFVNAVAAALLWSAIAQNRSI